MAADPWALSPATQQAMTEAMAGWAASYAVHQSDAVAWEAAIDALTAGTLRLLAAERTAADAAALYRTQEVHMSKKPSEQRRAEAADGRHDSKWWKGKAAQSKAAGNTAAARSERAHAASRLRDARRADPDR